MNFVDSYIKAIAHFFPEESLTNEDLSRAFPDWPADKILEKTGIYNRYIAAEGECASDLGVRACNNLFEAGAIQRKDVDFLILCTQSPDYFLPTTACLMQEKLGLSTHCGALDFNLGCSGFIYGLGLAKGLLETGQASNVLLVTAETYSKHIHPEDKSVRTLFGDAAAATVVGIKDGPAPSLGPFIYGTDGRGGENLIVKTGGMRVARNSQDSAVGDGQGNWRSGDNLFMNGPEIFTFTLREVPGLVNSLLAKSGKSMEDIDHFVFHQANQFMLESLRRKIKIPREKFILDFDFCGNTVSSSIPIVLENMMQKGMILPGKISMLVGFGVGYSWGALLVKW